MSFEEVAGSLISAFFGCKQILAVSPNICWALIWSDEVFFSPMLGTGAFMVKGHWPEKTER